ncbi:MAG: sigma-54-dependent Fis family transcriptional regulator [Deltaproteobacteria bacterium]|jgi:DNA-binding NtrC family response regulator|nr:sigma-54-dependent Fis family transcriptional regulator [Deltaproteobacteria bacterium]
MLIRVGLSVKNRNMQTHLEKGLSYSDVRVESFGHLRSAWLKVVRSGCDVIVISEALIPRPTENGIAILNDLPENPTTVIIHESDSAEEHAQLAAAGADVVLFEGVSRKSMLEALETTLDSRRQFIRMKRFDRRGLAEPKIADFVSESHVMQLFMEEVRQIIPSDSPILLLGETGVGKEHLAKAIHAESPRSAGPFISVNMAGMPEQLIESELFGHEQGAFTGAIRYRRGAFEMAHGGTLFLDEIGDMPLHMQAKLLRVLQNYEIKPVGGENILELDVRVIAATNQKMEDEISRGNFRQDLYYRLSVLMQTIPPLRERREDIPTMVRRFIAYYRYKIGREVNGISDQALQALCSYDWPGNVRELMNVIERAILLSKTGVIGIGELPNVLHGDMSAPGLTLPQIRFQSADLTDRTWPEVQKEIISQVEKIYLQQALKKTHGRMDQAARIAGIHPRGLFAKMKRLGLRKEDFKKQS